MQTELEKAQAEGNDRKAQGIEKGIEGLKRKLRISKQSLFGISYWVTYRHSNSSKTTYLERRKS